MKEPQNYVVVQEDETYVYWARWDNHTGGFYFHKKTDLEKQEKLKALVEKSITWENATPRQKIILSKLSYKLQKDLMQSAPYEFKPYFNKGDKSR